MFAHSLVGRPLSEWEPLHEHLQDVGCRAEAFASRFGWATVGRAVGLLHDIGKASADYQSYISLPREPGAPKGPDHSSAGAIEALAAYGPAGQMLAFAIAGHHAGLADGLRLKERLEARDRIRPYAGWQDHAGALPSLADLTPARQMSRASHAGFTQAFLTRMIFSCLVDADFLATEAYYDKAERRVGERGGFATPGELGDRLEAYMAGMASRAKDTPVNRLRAQVRDHALGKTGLPPGLFTLTVPTGGGKTLASLSFALRHARLHGLERVVYVIPFTSVIEQTANVFRQALGTGRDVLEHHASVDWEAERHTDDSDEEGPRGLIKLRKAAENWDAPIIVTTAVQFFESLFASRTSRCRKLHNLARSVIVLDEAQTLPLNLLLPCIAAIDELSRNYSASVVLCTATQPALRIQDDFRLGLDIGEDRELAPDPRSLYRQLKRVTVEVMNEPVPDETIVDRFSVQTQMLCIVNSRAHARKVFDAIGHLPGAVHLTTLMCPRHRREVLDQVRLKLKAGEPVRLVSTSLIEAGVDVDFPEVWRASAGLDSIAQAAGRCNREGLRASGRVVVFQPADAKPPRVLASFWQAARPVLETHEDVLGLDAVNHYFRELYWQKGREALDAVEVDGRRGVLEAIRMRAGDWSFPFRSIAEAFRLIDDVMAPVIVPWDDEARSVLLSIRQKERPAVADLRRLQQYVVGIPRAARDEWLERGVLMPVHAATGEEILMFGDLAHYRPTTGVDLEDTAMRSAESNMF